MLGKTLADLQSNISISAQNAVTGDINWVTGYTGFSSNFREQAGWYIALKIDASTIEGALEGATIVATYHGRDVTLDSDQIIIIRLADGEDTITFTANKEGYTEGRLTLDFSGLDKQEVNQSVYLTSETTGITISPMQFGNTKTISGQVPWDSTTNSNVMQLTAYPFFDVPSGTTYSLEGTYNGVGANIQITDGTFSTLDELDMTFSVPSEMIGQTGATFILMFEDPDNNRDYFTYDVTGLTLAPDPRPKVNITSDTTGVTITPATYNTSKTATGEVPYDTTTQKNILTVALTTSGILPTGPYTIEVFAQGDVMQQPIWYTTGASTIPQSIPIPLTSNEIGTGKYITVNTSGANDPEFSIITINTSALTLEAAPTPEGLNITLTSPASGVSISPSTVANNGTLNISGNWGTVSGLTINDSIMLYVETTFNVVNDWNFDDSTDYIDLTYFNHWGTSVGINQGIVSTTMALDFTQLAEAIRQSYPSKITLDHYAWNSSTQQHERAHTLEINLNYSNLTYPNQTGIYDGSIPIYNNSVNNFEFDGELPYSVDSQKYELSFYISTLGANLPNYNYIIYDNNGLDLTGHFSGVQYVFNNFTPTLQATGPFVLKTQTVNEQAQWVDVCPPITLDVSQITFGAPPPAELTSYDVNNVQFTKAQLYGTEGTMTVHGDGTSDSTYSVQIDGISFKAVSNPDYPDDTTPYFGAFTVNLPIAYTYSGGPVSFDILTGATVASAYSSYLTITEVDTTNKIVYFKLKKTPEHLGEQKYIAVNMKASSNNYSSNFKVYFTNATIAT